MKIKEYRNLIGREPFLAITWEPAFPQACSFRRMLMNHKNLHFTQIPDKNNDVISLKSPKIMFWGHFWLFLVIFTWWGFFPKNPALSHATMHHAKFQKKLMSQSRENVRTDGKTDRQTLFYRTLPAKTGGPIKTITI